MPVINTETVYIGKEKFIRRISVNKRGEFTADFPDFVKTQLGLKFGITAESKKDLLEKWNKTIEEYNKSTTEFTKVIIYQYDHKLVISLRVAVYEKRSNVTPSGKTYIHYDHLMSRLPPSLTPSMSWAGLGDGSVEILYSEKAENYFIALVSAIENFKLKLSDYLLDEKTTIEAKIKSGKQFPLI